LENKLARFSIFVAAFLDVTGFFFSEVFALGCAFSWRIVWELHLQLDLARTGASVVDLA